MLEKKLNKILKKVQKPGRYTGGELNSVVKDPKDVKIRYAFCFPDSYEIGMSNLGMKIICNVLNQGTTRIVSAFSRRGRTWRRK